MEEREKPIVFISYSHDSEEHKSWVKRLSDDLEREDCDVILDQTDLRMGQDIMQFMVSSIERADRVLVVCTPDYVAKSSGGQGGAAYERQVITQEMIKNLDTIKFVPIVRAAGSGDALPKWMGNRKYGDFRDDGAYRQRLTELVADLSQARAPHVPLGVATSPAGGAVVKPPAPAAPGSTVFEGFSAEALAWFAHHQALASKQFQRKPKEFGIEIAAEVVGKQPHASPAEWLKSAEAATVHNFGWPIGVIIPSRDEFRPRPMLDGVYAMLNIHDPDRVSFDYWAIRVNGDFYTMKSAFEDRRDPGAVFLDTRIVRTTEALMYLEGLYRGVLKGEDKTIRIQFVWSGLSGRTLKVASGRRHIFPRKCELDCVPVAIECRLSEIRSKMADHVRTLLTPLFHMFEFFVLGDDIYKEISDAYQAGRLA